MKKILLLGGSRFLVPVIREAKALGCHTITCDYLPDNIAHRYSDEYHNVSITDREAVLSLARELQVDLSEITKRGGASKLLTGINKEDVPQ